jgi:hypothetical protein
MCVEI